MKEHPFQLFHFTTIISHSFFPTTPYLFHIPNINRKFTILCITHSLYRVLPSLMKLLDLCGRVSIFNIQIFPTFPWMMVFNFLFSHLNIFFYSWIFRKLKNSFIHSSRIVEQGFSCNPLGLGHIKIVIKPRKEINE